MDKKDLSDEDDDDWDIEPDHYWGDGKIPIFKPVCDFAFIHALSGVNWPMTPC